MFHLRSVVLGLVGATLLAGSVGAAGEVETNPAVQARKAMMELISFSYGPISAMAKGEMPYDADLATKAAENLLSTSRIHISPMYPEGTDNASIDGTTALPAIWSNMTGFEAGFAALTTAAEAMVEAAGTDLDALKAAAGAIGATCGGCHKDFRQRH